MATSDAILAFLAAAGGALAAGRLRPSRAAWSSAAAAGAGCLLFAAAWSGGGGVALDVPWLASLGSRLRLDLDALAAPLALFTCAVAAIVLAYADGYLRADGAPAAEVERFARLFLGFLGAMLLLLCAQDLLLVFVALELTAVLSFLLIELRRDEEEARRAAVFALVLTAGSSLLFLAGTAGVAQAAGTTVLDDLAPLAQEGALPRWALVCLALGVLAKSAQFPLHVWLPRAMVAPTPVSAFLHSAALVAAGVFVLLRLTPLFTATPRLSGVLLAVAGASIVLGSAMALTSDRLKRILAYSTIAQMGYVLALVALGALGGDAGDVAVAGAPLAIVAHGLCKAGLFLTAGAVTATHGVHRLSEARGLLRGRPLLAAASAVCAAGLAGLPLTVGFAKDDVLLEAAHAHGPASFVAAAAAIALTFAYVARFWGGLVLGGTARRDRGPGPALVWPTVVLAALALAGGVARAPLERAFAAAGAEAAGRPVGLELAAPWELRPANAAAWTAWIAGALVLATLRSGRLARIVAAVTAVASPAALAERLGAAVRRASDEIHARRSFDLRARLCAFVLPTALLVLAGPLFRYGVSTDVSPLRAAHAPEAAALAVVAFGAFAAVRLRGLLSLALVLSFVGFGLAVAFALAGAPNVALVVVLVETGLTLLFVGLLARIPPRNLRPARESGPTLRRFTWTAVAAGLMGFLVAWHAAARPAVPEAARAHVELAGEAHGKDVVTVILADLRGLDTAGEITVLAVAVLGALAVGRERRT